MTGTVRKDERAPGGYEICGERPAGLPVGGADYPIAPKEHGVGFLMEHRHLWLRSTRQQAVLRIRAEVIKAVRDYLDNNGLRAGRHAHPDRPPPARAPPPCSRPTISAQPAFLRRAASFTTRPTSRPSAGSTASGQPSAPRRARPAAT